MRLVLRDELRGVPCLCDGHVPSSWARRAPVVVPRLIRLAGVVAGSRARIEFRAPNDIGSIANGYAETADRFIRGARGAGWGNHLLLQVGHPAAQDDAVTASGKPCPQT